MKNLLVKIMPVLALMITGLMPLRAQLVYEKISNKDVLTFGGNRYDNATATTWYGNKHVWVNSGGTFRIDLYNGLAYLSGSNNEINFKPSAGGGWNNISAGHISAYGDIYGTGDMQINKNLQVGNNPNSDGKIIAYGGITSKGGMVAAAFTTTIGHFTTTSGTYNTTNGSYYTTYGGYYVLSDISAKTNLASVKNATQTVLALRPVTYEWRDREYLQYKRSSPLAVNSQEIGFISQEVEQVLPGIISIDDDGQKFLNYQALIPVLTGAIQELNARIEALERQLGVR